MEPSSSKILAQELDKDENFLNDNKEQEKIKNGNPPENEEYLSSAAHSSKAPRVDVIVVQDRLDITNQPLGASKCDLSSMNQSSLQDNAKLLRFGKAEDKPKEENKIKNDMSIDPTQRHFIKQEIMVTETIIAPSEGAQKEFINILTNPLTPIEIIKKLIMDPLPKDLNTFQCTVTKDTTGIMNKLYYKFTLTASATNSFLMLGQKSQIVPFSRYTITLDKSLENRLSPGVMGKISANFKATEYNFYDDGEKYDKTNTSSLLRIQHGSLIFENNLLDSGLSKLKVLLPKLQNDNQRIIWKPTRDSEAIIPFYRSKILDKLLCLVNKQPKWNPAAKMYTLDFDKRVTMPSAKNFLLVDSENVDGPVILQFGKANQYQYNLDFRYPLSIYQAFSVSLAILDLLQSNN